jgi:tetratricopeptide (TPR) repeat protein
VASLSTHQSIELQEEVERIRELSRRGKNSDALSAAAVLLGAAPHSREVLYLIAANQRCLNQLREALETLQRLEQNHPRFSLLYQERGYCYVTLRDAPHAIEAFLQAVSINPALAASWIMLERLYRMTGQTSAASMAAEQVSILEQLPSEVVRAGSLFADGELAAAEKILQIYLSSGGNHVEGLRLLARIERQWNALDTTEGRLKTVLTVAPNYRAARLDYIQILLDQQKYPQACEAADSLLTTNPADKDVLSLYAAACVGVGRHDQAIEMYGRLLAASPNSPELHVALGHSLQIVGRRNEAIDSYRKAGAIRPSFGDAYWSLANLKTYRFSDDEIARMRAEESTAAPVDRFHFCFALGKAYEERSQLAESWEFYERGNALKHIESHYCTEIIETITRRQIEICTKEFFAARAGFGLPDPDPIFVVGLPRSGSTLVEQILASHSQVDGTQELADIPRIVRGLNTHGAEDTRSYRDTGRYPAILADLSSDDFRMLGERYTKDTRAYRGSRPYFIDKMPNNFRHVGFIHLILPNAKIIDVRREPTACCFSNLKQLFACGQEFTYSTEDVARYYKNYLELMRHWDAVLPGRVLRVCYEDVVEDLQSNVQRLLKFCGLEFETACTEFYKSDRSVHTASSEQVRQPLFREGLTQWKNYEPWLGPLKDALGDALVRYRG